MIAASAAFYLLLGHVWWRKAVVPKTDFISTNGADEATLHWQQDALLAEARGEVALLTVKATFVLLWPLALILGFILAAARRRT